MTILIQVNIARVTLKGIRRKKKGAWLIAGGAICCLLLFILFVLTLSLRPDLPLLANTFFVSSSSVILPVTWDKFNITRNADKFTWSWHLSTEENVAGYSPQYSANGVDFINAGTINSFNADHSYAFTASLSLSTVAASNLQKDLCPHGPRSRGRKGPLRPGCYDS